MSKSWKVVIPEWQNYYQKSGRTMPKYWLWRDRERLPSKHLLKLASHPVKVGKKEYCCDGSGERFLKNTKSVGKPNLWILNGQDLYNGNLDWRMRKKVAGFFHEYFSKYIKKQIKPIKLLENELLSVSCDIYEVKRRNMPDVSNMWLLEKFFEDSLQDCGIIADDDPDHVIESGRKQYHWVSDPKDRKLVFTIKIL